MWGLLLYFLIAIVATTVGSMTGMGGGIIIKPFLDVLNQYDVQTIGALSAITVLFMSVVSIGKQMIAKVKIPFNTAVPLALGSVAGGFIGQWILSASVAALKSNSAITVIQNVLLSILILCVYAYMKNKSKIKSLNLTGLFATVPAGLFLGICSSFLGIGGGPINVALIIYLFSYSTKTATICSLITVLFAQISKIGTIAFAPNGFGEYDLTMLPVMIIGAIAGGFIGSSFNKRCSEKTVEKAFNAVQLLVLAIAMFNIFKNIF